VIVEVYSEPGRSTDDRVLGFLRVYHHIHGKAPKIQAIAAGLGLNVHAVGAALARLEQSGRVSTHIRVAHTHDGMEPLPAPEMEAFQ